ncbi:MAG TPA: carbohydrate ABC transporter permease [Xanthobacteraceae bacterium]|nr:carbohydrate ABC transporter permease [Xanthobacteraceae bacterium]
MKSRAMVGSAVAYVVSLLLVVFIGFPLLWMLVSSFKPAEQLFVSPPRLLPSTLTLDWYRNVMLQSDAPTYFRNSLVIGAATTAICLSIGTLAAYGVTRFEFPGKRVFLIGALLSYVFPAIVLFVPIYMIINSLGLIDTLAGVVIAHTILTFPFALWMLRSFFIAIPREIDEAAWVDGASYFMTFVAIILPLALPGVFSVGVFVFVLSWNEYLFAGVLITSGSLKTIPVGISEFITSFDVRWGEIMAMGALATMPVIALFLAVQRFFLRGVIAGAIKG